jgi:hypothetical protein
MKGNMKYAVVALGILVVVLAIYNVMLEAQTDSLKTAKTAAVTSAVQDGAKAERDAYVAGLLECQAQDMATFHDMVQNLNAEGYDALADVVQNWADGWEYTDKQVQELLDAYMMTGEDYQ